MESDSSENVIVIGQDIDLLVILHELGISKNNLFFKKVGDAKTDDAIYTSNCFMYEKIKHIVGFIHAFSGCDTTSGFYFHTKNSVASVINKNDDLIKEAENFYSADSTEEALASSGCKIISKVYSPKNTTKVYLQRKFTSNSICC